LSGARVSLPVGFVAPTVFCGPGALLVPTNHLRRPPAPHPHTRNKAQHAPTTQSGTAKDREGTGCGVGGTGAAAGAGHGCSCMVGRPKVERPCQFDQHDVDCPAQKWKSAIARRVSSPAPWPVPQPATTLRPARLPSRRSGFLRCCQYQPRRPVGGGNANLAHGPASQVPGVVAAVTGVLHVRQCQACAGSKQALYRPMRLRITAAVPTPRCRSR
jgi:hypothetical protein